MLGAGDVSGARGQDWPPGMGPSGARQKIKSKSDGSGDLEERFVLRCVGFFEENEGRLLLLPRPGGPRWRSVPP